MSERWNGWMNKTRNGWISERWNGYVGDDISVLDLCPERTQQFEESSFKIITFIGSRTFYSQDFDTAP